MAAAVPVALAVAVAVSTLRTSGQQLAHVSAQTAHPSFGARISTLVAMMRPRVTARSVAVIVHPRSIEAWLYYMNDYGGYPAAVAEAARIPEARTLYPPIKAGRLPALLPARVVDGFLDRHDPDRVFVYALFLTPKPVVNTELRDVESNGYRVTEEWTASVSGEVYELDLASAGHPAQIRRMAGS